MKRLACVPLALGYGLEAKIKIPLVLEANFSGKEAIEESRRLEKGIKQKAKPEFMKKVKECESLYYNLIEALGRPQTNSRPRSSFLLVI